VEVNPTCPYCGVLARLETGAAMYPHRPDLSGVYVWTCRPCFARVGCHPDTKIPLGSMANKELRSARIAAHEAFDVHWARKGALSRGGWKPRRSDAYLWLADRLGIAYEQCHIGSFDLATCQRVILICRDDAP
jgi:hypothetical protein